MSVPTWNRTLSTTEYINQLAELNDLLREVVIKKPAKLRASYGDSLIQEGLLAYLNAYDADRTSIRKGDPIDNYDRRIKYLRSSLSHVDHVEMIAELMLGPRKGMDYETSDKYYNEQKKIGFKVYHCKDLINGSIDDTKIRRRNELNRLDKSKQRLQTA